MAKYIQYLIPAPFPEPKIHINFKRTHSFLERLFDRAAYRHHFTGTLHCSCEMLVCCHEFIKWPSRDLDYRVIHSWFKRGWGFLCDVVCDLIKCHADSDLCSDPGYGVSGCF